MKPHNNYGHNSTEPMYHGQMTPQHKQVRLVSLRVAIDFTVLSVGQVHPTSFSFLWGRFSTHQNVKMYCQSQTACGVDPTCKFNPKCTKYTQEIPHNVPS